MEQAERARDCRFVLVRDGSVAFSAVDWSWVRRSEICSPAEIATSRVEEGARFSESDTADLTVWR